MNYQQAISYLRRNKIFPLYLLVGKEILLKEHFLKILLKLVFNDKVSSMNYKVIYGSDMDSSILSTFLYTASLFGGRKVCVIRNYREIKAKERKKFSNFVEDFLSRNTKNILIIMNDEEMGKDPILNLIKKKGMVVRFDIPEFDTLVNWVKNGIEGKGKKIEEDAIYLLLSHSGDELMSIKNEIDKLITYAEGEEYITVDMVAELLGLKKGVTIFDFLSAFRKRETTKALLILNELSLIEPLPKILFSLEGEIKKLIGLKIYMEEGVDYNTLKRKMGISPRLLNEMIAHLPEFSKEELFSMLKELYKVNLVLRENYSLGILPLENFVKKTIRTQRPQ